MYRLDLSTLPECVLEQCEKLKELRELKGGVFEKNDCCFDCPHCNDEILELLKEFCESSQPPKKNETLSKYTYVYISVGSN